ncbi:MAG: hypothetical protein JOZ32_18630 [Bryobacterales bacterium]|nr:hypothetical protein [Bryobacterales bacterium]
MHRETITSTAISRLAALEINLLPELLLGGLCLLVGIAIVRMPNAAWALLGLAVGIALLELPPAIWVIAAVAAAGLLRMAVWFGLPSFLDFLHFPLVLGAVVAVTLKTRHLDGLARKLRLGAFVLLVISIISCLINGGEPLRPVLVWLVFLEPFLLLFALIASKPGPMLAGVLWRTVLLIAALQLPLGVFQYLFIAHGNPDFVEGTFFGQSGGAHVSGAAALIGVLLCIARAAYLPSARRFKYFIAAGLMFILPVISDAKQTIVCFLPGLLLLILLSGRMRLSRIVVPTAVTTLILSLAYIYYPPLQMVADPDLIWGGLNTKMVGVRHVFQHLDDAPAGWVLGLGPGNSISRVAWLSSGGLAMESSPVSKLGLKLAPTTKELLLDDQQNFLANSSVFTMISSWLGLLGDLGILGLMTYVLVCIAVWKAVSYPNCWENAAAKAGMTMAGLLGIFYSWLEEPGFTLLLAAVIGLAILAGKRQNSPEVPEFQI